MVPKQVQSHEYAERSVMADGTNMSKHSQDKQTYETTDRQCFNDT